MRIHTADHSLESGVSFELRVCFDCPDFFLIERGFGFGGVFSPLVLVSLPAIQVSKDFSTYSIPDVKVLPFGSALVIEAMLAGMIIASARAARRGYRSRHAASQQC